MHYTYNVEKRGAVLVSWRETWYGVVWYMDIDTHVVKP